MTETKPCPTCDGTGCDYGDRMCPDCAGSGEDRPGLREG
jgi:DnaJ-class molecular chaperone